MRIAIDAPAVRSLSANEKMVYRFLKDGLTPTEIAHRMHIPVGKGGYVNQTCELPGESIMGIITSIREKGWDIPTDNNKEEAEMPIVKLSEEAKRNIVTAFQAGATAAKLAEQYNVTKRAVYNVINAWRESGETALSGETEIAEKEPETAATESGSEENVVSNDSADIVTPSEENVKCEDKKSETVIPQAVIEACLEKRLSLIAQIEEEQLLIDDWQSQIADINSFLELAKGGAAV